MSIVRAVPAPPDSVLAPLYPDADLLDAFAAPLSAGATNDLDRLAHAVLARPAWWMKALMGMRDAAMAPLGVKTSRAIARERNAGDRIGFFPVQGRTSRELIVGEDDRHLDFRAAILLQDGADGARTLTMITVVHCHNRLGRYYLAVIAPFHRAIVRANIVRAARRGWPEGGERR